MMYLFLILCINIHDSQKHDRKRNVRDLSQETNDHFSTFSR